MVYKLPCPNGSANIKLRTAKWLVNKIKGNRQESVMKYGKILSKMGIFLKYLTAGKWLSGKSSS
jgi:hypothetical protein